MSKAIQACLVCFTITCAFGWAGQMVLHRQWHESRFQKDIAEAATANAVEAILQESRNPPSTLMFIAGVLCFIAFQLEREYARR